MSCATDETIMRPDPNLCCPICLDVFNVPVRTPCGHIFCKGCLENWMSTDKQQCPECREVVEMDKVCTDRLADRMVENMHSTCQLRSKGCCWVGRRGDRVAHLATECQHVTLFCPNPGCEEEVLRDELTAHLETCSCSPQIVDDDGDECDECDEPTPLESCPFGCGEQCEPTQLAAHKLACLLEPRKLLAAIGRLQDAQAALAGENARLKLALAQSLVGRKRSLDDITEPGEEVVTLGRYSSAELI